MTEFLDPDHETFGDIAGDFTDPATDPVAADGREDLPEAEDVEASTDETREVARRALRPLP